MRSPHDGPQGDGGAHARECVHHIEQAADQHPDVGPRLGDEADAIEPVDASWSDPITDVTGALGLSITDIIRLRLRDR